MNEKVGRRVEVIDLASLAAWYAKKSVPPAFRNTEPAVLRVALRLAKGDWRRVTIDPDGAIIVHNRPMWQPE